MKSPHQSIIARVAVCALLMAATVTAKAQIVAKGPCIGACKSQVIGILVGIAAGGAALGIGTYYAIHHGHSLTGCAVSSPSGLQLMSQGDLQTYSLVGEVADIKPGERVRVSGKKEKKNTAIPRQFLVEKLTKVYGTCTAAP